MQQNRSQIILPKMMAEQCLINAITVTDQKSLTPEIQFEFIINSIDDTCKIIECVKLLTATTTNNYCLTPIKNFNEIHTILFELNHVRVNPAYNNQDILTKLTNMLTNVGVRIYNKPAPNSLAVCYQPLGEFKDPVRFYVQANNEVVFLCSQAKPKLVICNK